MAKAIFTTKVNPAYNDLPELMYHFPKTYLKQASAAIGDWVIYYEPRREGVSDAGRAGRQCYFATALVTNIKEDIKKAGHYYAFVDKYLEFESPVPFKIGNFYFESGLRKPDGTTNKGAFGRSVRIIDDNEYDAILAAGLANIEKTTEIEEEHVEPVIQFEKNRHLISQIVERPFREAAFSRIVKEEYGLACAMTGICIKDGHGNNEVEAAHIKPVQYEGPDSIRNGIALSRTFHWMFDRGLVTIADSGDIITVEKMIPDRVLELINDSGKIRVPASRISAPHPQFLKFHRDQIFNSTIV